MTIWLSRRAPHKGKRSGNSDSSERPCPDPVLDIPKPGSDFGLRDANGSLCDLGGGRRQPVRFNFQRLKFFSRDLLVVIVIVISCFSERCVHQWDFFVERRGIRLPFDTLRFFEVNAPGRIAVPVIETGSDAGKVSSSPLSRSPLKALFALRLLLVLHRLHCWGLVGACHLMFPYWVHP